MLRGLVLAEGRRVKNLSKIFTTLKFGEAGETSNEKNCGSNLGKLYLSFARGGSIFEEILFKFVYQTFGES